ncbi:hypothetical protein HK100_012932 [Physocladia obscura]|uniref:Zonadhesin n=1 Tax=Physocladia obscura TaxID=109957 RepID=A0AAD5XFW7_9FUNG|nr:hypothetical protein HK100_012932 [Physocladia obscura]
MIIYAIISILAFQTAASKANTVSLAAHTSSTIAAIKSTIHDSTTIVVIRAASKTTVHATPTIAIQKGPAASHPIALAATIHHLQNSAKQSHINLVHNPNFNVPCSVSDLKDGNKYCISKTAKNFSPWIVGSCSFIPETIQKSCIPDEYEIDYNIFNTATNLDLNPNGPSSVYQDVAIHRDSISTETKGLELKFKLGHQVCGNITFNLLEASLVYYYRVNESGEDDEKILLGRSTFTGIPTWTKHNFAVKINPKGEGFVRITFTSKTPGSCGPLIAEVGLYTTEFDEKEQKGKETIEFYQHNNDDKNAASHHPIAIVNHGENKEKETTAHSLSKILAVTEHLAKTTSIGHISIETKAVKIESLGSLRSHNTIAIALTNKLALNTKSVTHITSTTHTSALQSKIELNAPNKSSTKPSTKTKTSTINKTSITKKISTIAAPIAQRMSAVSLAANLKLPSSYLHTTISAGGNKVANANTETAVKSSTKKSISSNRISITSLAVENKKAVSVASNTKATKSSNTTAFHTTTTSSVVNHEKAISVKKEADGSFASKSLSVAAAVSSKQGSATTIPLNHEQIPGLKIGISPLNSQEKVLHISTETVFVSVNSKSSTKKISTVTTKNTGSSNTPHSAVKVVEHHTTLLPPHSISANTNFLGKDDSKDNHVIHQHEEEKTNEHHQNIESDEETYNSKVSHKIPLYEENDAISRKSHNHENFAAETKRNELNEDENQYSETDNWCHQQYSDNEDKADKTEKINEHRKFSTNHHYNLEDCKHSSIKHKKEEQDNLLYENDRSSTEYEKFRREKKFKKHYWRQKEVGREHNYDDRFEDFQKREYHEVDEREDGNGGDNEHVKRKRRSVGDEL